MTLRDGKDGAQEASYVQFDTRNMAGALNIGIVMYSQVPLFESHCCGLCEIPIIHLLREPNAVARSVVQMRADKCRLGTLYKPHYRAGERPHAKAVIDPMSVGRWTERVAASQAEFAARIRGNARVLSLNYEELTGNRETSELPRAKAEEILAFLGLPYCRLVNDLQKTGS